MSERSSSDEEMAERPEDDLPQKGLWHYVRQRDLTRVLLLVLTLVAVIVGSRHCGTNVSGVIEQLDREAK